MAHTVQVAVFGGGCFWCTEAVFQMLQGVIKVEPGYAGGTMENPSYENVTTGKTGHAEVIRIEYDPALIKYTDLLTVFFASHDPTTMNRQGNDVGEQYRSAILYTTDEQREQAVQYIEELKTTEGLAVVTEVKPLDTFHPAEDYHRNYYRENSNQPYCQFVINPKLKKVRERFALLLKNTETEG